MPGFGRASVPGVDRDGTGTQTVVVDCAGSTVRTLHAAAAAAAAAGPAGPAGIVGCVDNTAGNTAVAAAVVASAHSRTFVVGVVPILVGAIDAVAGAGAGAVVVVGGAVGARADSGAADTAADDDDPADGTARAVQPT